MDARLHQADSTHAAAVSAGHERERGIESKNAQLMANLAAVRSDFNAAAGVQAELATALQRAVGDRESARGVVASLQARIQVIEGATVVVVTPYSPAPLSHTLNSPPSFNPPPF